MSDASPPSHDDNIEGLLSDIAQMLLTMLFLQPDAEQIALPRCWLAAWLQDIQYVIGVLRDTAQH
jgi:hypothetical protein